MTDCFNSVFPEEYIMDDQAKGQFP